MKKCKHVNGNGHCTIGASSSGNCRLPCSHLEYEKCKFEDLKATNMFESKSELYMKTNVVYGTPNGYGNAVNLNNGTVYIIPNDTEVMLVNSVTF